MTTTDVSAPITLPYTRDLERRLRNLSSLPRGTGGKFLLCVRGEGDALVAKRWCRVMPKRLGAGEVLVAF